MAANSCWGVEVGLGALKAVKLVRTSDGVEVADWAIIPHKRVLSAPETDEKDAKRVAVGSLVSQKDLSKSTLAVSVSGAAAFARFAKLPPVDPKKVDDIVQFEAVQQIPFPIDEVEWDYQIFNSGASGEMAEIEVGIFAMTRDRVQEKLDKWHDAGQTPDVMTLSPLAAYNALAYDLTFTEGMPGTVILDIGATSTDLVVADGGRLWIRTFPIGGHQFTEALVTAFNLSYVKAEKLKKEAENSQAARHVLQALRPVFNDLAQDVQRSIGYYTSLHKEAKLTRLIGLGSTWHLPGLRKYLSQQLSMEVTRLESFQRLKLEGEKNTEFQASAVNLATAYGLALQGLGLQTIDANLMPIAATRKAVWADKTKYLVGAAVCLGIAGLAANIRPFLDSAAIAASPKPAGIEQVKSEAQGRKREWTEVENADKPDPRAAIALDLLAGREIYGHMLRDLGEVMASADAKLPTEKGKPARVALLRWNTTYRGPGGATNPDGSPAPPPSAPPPGDPSAAGADHGRIRCELDILIAQPEREADKTVIESVRGWLDANAKRDGLPYFLDAGTFQVIPGGEEVISTGGLGAAGGNPPLAAGGPGGVPGENVRRPNLPGQPRLGDERSGQPGGNRPNIPIGQPIGAAPPQGGEAGTLAPLPQALPIGEEGKPVTKYRVVWEAVLTAPPAPAPASTGGGQ